MRTMDVKFDTDIIAKIKDGDILYEEENGYREFTPIEIILYGNNIIEFYADKFDITRDSFYYRKVEAELDHLLFKWYHRWFTSRRQIVLISEDCFSVIQLIEFQDKDSLSCIELNVYQRSCNIDDALINDIAFLCCWLRKQRLYKDRIIRILNIIPHSFINGRTKVEQKI